MAATSRPSLELLPLVEPAGRNDAAPGLERLGERVAGAERLGPGVDHPVPDGRILGPGRHEAPAHLAQTAPLPVSRSSNGHDRLGRCQFPARWDAVEDYVVDAEAIGQAGFVLVEGESATHRTQLGTPVERCSFESVSAPVSRTDSSRTPTGPIGALQARLRELLPGGGECEPSPRHTPVSLPSANFSSSASDHVRFACSPGSTSLTSSVASK